MPFFTAIGAAIFGAGTFLAGATSFALGIAANYALSFVAKAFAGTPAGAATAHFSTQGTLNAGGDVQRSMLFGYCSTAGSLVYANAWGADGETPNAYFTQVIALSDLPIGGLREVWINGEQTALDTNAHPDFGYPALNFRKDGRDHLWIKFHDGTQTTVDNFVASQVASADRPYETSRVGHGVAYVICTALTEDTLYTGFPTYKFAVDGVKLYDPSKDSTVGGNGSHRYNTPSTWGGDGDGLPVVQVYNLIRGMSFNGRWLYGLQNVPAVRLPADNWIAQIAKCRAEVMGTNGLEPTYRSGGEVQVSAPVADAIEALLASCAGRVAEIGGFYKIYVGAPDDPVFAFTDDEILSSEEQTFSPFLPLSKTINGITARYPSPAQFWNTVVAPPLYNNDFEAEDGNRRLLSDINLTFVPFDAQVQRLMKAGLEEARRGRRHTVTLPPEFWECEPGNIVAWTSERNGYDAKLFRIDAMVDKANLDVMATITEVDPTDYDWNHTTDFKPVTYGPTGFGKVTSQGVTDWYAEGAIIKDDDGLSRRPAIHLSWDGTLAGIVGVTYQVRLAMDLSPVAEGNTDQFDVGAINISQSILPNVTYQVRGQYVPSAPRPMLWSGWITLKTPNVNLSLVDFEKGVKNKITELENVLTDRLNVIEDLFAKQIQDIAARNLKNKFILNEQSWDHRVDVINRIAVGDATLGASIDDVRTVANNDRYAFAQYQITVNAHLGAIDASVQQTLTSIANLNGAFAQYQLAVATRFGTVEASVVSVSTAISTLDTAFSQYQATINAKLVTTDGKLTTIQAGVDLNAQAIATLNSAYSSYTTTTTAQIGALTSSVTVNSQSIVTLNGQAASKYSVTLDTNGYATGFTLLNGGSGVSTFTVTVDQFQIAYPNAGYGAVPIFTVGSVNGTPRIGIRSDMYIDGTITANKMNVGTLSAITANIGTVTAGVIQSANAKMFIDLNANRIVIFD